MSENTGLPALYCPIRSKLNLDVMQFSVLHEADRTKAAWTGKRLQQARRQLGLHDAVSPCCSEAMAQ
jgi:hypothetical protein